MRKTRVCIDYNKHRCAAVLVYCMDFRIDARSMREMLTGAFEGKESVVPFDEIKIAGGAKAIVEEAHRELILQNIKLSVEAHSVKTVIVMNHHDCGAYGGKAEFNNDESVEEKFHVEELRRAGKIVTEFLASIGKSEVSVVLAYINASHLIPVTN